MKRRKNAFAWIIFMMALVSCKSEVDLGIFEGSGEISIAVDIEWIGQGLDSSSAYVDAAVHGDGLTSIQYRGEMGTDLQQWRSALQLVINDWSPDGAILAYYAERNGNYDVYAIPVDGGKEKRLTTADGLDDGPEYSPDGKYIYFNSERSGTMWLLSVIG